MTPPSDLCLQLEVGWKPLHAYLNDGISPFLFCDYFSALFKLSFETRSGYVAQAGLEIMIFSSQPPVC
jgi:hypothetical protein